MTSDTKYLGLNNAEARQGFTKPGDDIPRSDDPFDNVPAEIDSLEKPEGFLERQNVFERI